MLLSRYRRFPHKLPVTWARPALGFLPASPPAFVLHASLPHSYFNSFPSSEVGKANLKISGLRLSIPLSATQNLAYFPCLVAGDVSTFLFFSGGGVSEKNCSPPHPQDAVFLAALWAVFALPSSPLFQERFDAI